jgi:hypothetical protein
MFASCKCCIGIGLCDGLITRPEESYRMCVGLIVCDLQTLTVRRPWPELGCGATAAVGLWRQRKNVQL